MTTKAAPRPKTIRLNILRTYAVQWDAETLVRDVLQNFFDASRDFEGVSIHVDREGGVVRIEGPVPFALDYVKFIGGTTKAKGGFAGQFGEGFKVSALVALRDFGLRLAAGAGTWRIEPAFEKVSVGEELVYRTTTGPDLAGSFVELRGCSPELADLFADGHRYFRWSGNPSFGECLFSEGDVHVYRMPSREQGQLYYGKQLRGSLWRIPFALCLDRTLKNVRRDRDRRILLANQVRVVMFEIGRHLPLDVGMTIANECEDAWTNERENLVYLLVGLEERHKATYAGGVWPTRFPENWVAGETESRFRHANSYARRGNYRVAAPIFGRIGMRRAREIWLSSITYVDDEALTVVQRARRALLLAAGRMLYAGSHPPLRFARMTNQDGEYRRDEIVLQASLLDGSFDDALSTYLHELCHEAGRDGDAKFSDALTTALGATIARAGAVNALRLSWYGVEKADRAQVEEALRSEEPARQLADVVHPRSRKDQL